MVQKFYTWFVYTFFLYRNLVYNPFQSPSYTRYSVFLWDKCIYFRYTSSDSVTENIISSTSLEEEREVDRILNEVEVLKHVFCFEIKIGNFCDKIRSRHLILVLGVANASADSKHGRIYSLTDPTRSGRHFSSHFVR